MRIPYNEKTLANYKKGLKGSGTLYNGEIKDTDGILNVEVLRDKRSCDAERRNKEVLSETWLAYWR